MRLKSDVGISAPVSPVDLGTAIRVRTANKTLKDWHQWHELLLTSFDASACLISLSSGPPRLSPPHWLLKPFAQVLFDATPKNQYHAKIQESVFADFSNRTTEILFDAISSGKGSLQAVIYRQAVCDNPANSVANYLRQYNCKHSRKAGNPIIHGLCDKILLDTDILVSKLKANKNKYGSWQVLRFVCNAFCVPARFGVDARTPFCRTAKFCQRHLVSCTCFNKLIIEATSECCTEVVHTIVMLDFNHLLLNVIAAIATINAKQRRHVLNLVPVASIAISTCVHEPTIRLPALIDKLRQNAIARA